jgi:two-component system CheB/CheR fusion protein
MNEELQSTNDELEVVTGEQRERSGELDRVNLFLEGIVGSLGLAVVVVDRNQYVQLWNPSATEMWGLRRDEALGEHFLGLDLGLPLDELRGPLRRALEPRAKPGEVTVEAVNRRGRAFRCLVRMLPLVTAGGETYGAIVLMSAS